MNIKSSICGIQHTCINFLIFLICIITKIECWPIFKQDPKDFQGPMILPVPCNKPIARHRPKSQAGWRGITTHKFGPQDNAAADAGPHRPPAGPRGGIEHPLLLVLLALFGGFGGEEGEIRGCRFIDGPDTANLECGCSLGAATRNKRGGEKER